MDANVLSLLNGKRRAPLLLNFSCTCLTTLMLRLVTKLAKLAKSCHVATYMYHKVGYCTNLIILTIVTVWSQSLRGSYPMEDTSLQEGAMQPLKFEKRLRITSYKMTVHVILSYPSLVPRPAVSGLGTRQVLPERGPPVSRRMPLEYSEIQL